MRGILYLGASLLCLGGVNGYSPVSNTPSLAIRDDSTTMPLPDPRRYITDNDDNGQSFFSKDTSESVAVANDLGGALLRLAYTTTTGPPVNLTADNDLDVYTAALSESPPLVRTDNGTNLWYIDTPPNSESPLHRTVSLDFVIQVIGTIELILSNGEQRIINPGDITIQRSTLHKWRNPSTTEWSRMVGVMTKSQPVVTKNSGTLGVSFPPH